MGVSRGIAYMIEIGLISIENDKYQNLIKHRVTWWELLNEEQAK